MNLNQLIFQFMNASEECKYIFKLNKFKLFKVIFFLFFLKKSYYKKHGTIFKRLSNK
jgi:hypothetical protein